MVVGTSGFRAGMGETQVGIVCVPSSKASMCKGPVAGGRGHRDRKKAGSLAEGTREEHKEPGLEGLCARNSGWILRGMGVAAVG